MRSLSVLALLGWTTAVLSHNIQMGAHRKECFHEQLHKDDKMTVTFQVGDREFGGAGNLEVDFWVSLLAQSMSDGVGHGAEVHHHLHDFAALIANQIMPHTYRYKILPVHTSSIIRPSLRATIASTRKMMGNIPTASATRIGRRARRKSVSTYTG